jgi:cell division transport system permease protein
MNRVRMLFSEAWSSITANASTTFAATMTVLIGMFLLGLLIAFATWAHSWGDHAKKELLVKVYFCTTITCKHDVTPAEINAVRAKLQRDPRVKTVVFVSKAQALKEMKRKYPDLFRTPLAANPLPDSEEVTPTKGEYTPMIAASLTNPPPPGVESVKYGKKTAHKILRAAHIIDVIFIVGVIVLVIASTILIANTIRLSIFARRREIEVMKLVGATNWFVRGPFMLEGLICGFFGSALAVVLLLLGKELALPAILGHVSAGSDVHAWPFGLIALILILGGFALGSAGSGVTLRRFLQV